MSYPYVMYSSQFSHQSWKRVLLGVLTVLTYLITLAGLALILPGNLLIFGVGALAFLVVYLRIAGQWMKGFKEKKLKVLRFDRGFHHFQFEWNGEIVQFSDEELSARTQDHEVLISAHGKTFSFPSDISTAGSFRTQLHLFGTGSRFFDYFAIVERSRLGFRISSDEGKLQVKAYGRFNKFWPENKVY